ncbi:MAG: hypothetical protein ABH803_02055 [Candidatus Micrarchaeota archaeon]
MTYSHIVSKAWAGAKKGLNEDFEGFRLHKDKKMLTFVCESKWLNAMKREAAKKKSERNNYHMGLHVVVFPQLEHLTDFTDASSGVRRGGPSSYNPEAIGTMRFAFVPAENKLHLEYVQSHFKSQSNNDLFMMPDEVKLSRSLATKYGGWRQKALQAALVFVKHAGLKGLRFSKEFLDLEKGFNEQFKQFIKKNKIKVKDEGKYLLLKPK